MKIFLKGPKRNSINKQSLKKKRKPQEIWRSQPVSLTDIPEGNDRKKGEVTIFKKIIADSLPKLMSHRNPFPDPGRTKIRITKKKSIAT